MAKVRSHYSGKAYVEALQPRKKKLGAFACDSYNPQVILAGWARHMVKKGYAPGMSARNLASSFKAEPDGMEFLIFHIDGDPDVPDFRVSPDYFM